MGSAVWFSSKVMAKAMTTIMPKMNRPVKIPMAIFALSESSMTARLLLTFKCRSNHFCKSRMHNPYIHPKGVTFTLLKTYRFHTYLYLVLSLIL